MTQLKRILLAIALVFGRLFALPTSAARRGDNKGGGFNFLPALCAAFFAAIIGGTTFAGSHLPPLHQAVADGNIAEIKRLIDGGADVNAKSDKGNTPLHSARNPEIALILIKAGADMDAKDEMGNTHLHSLIFLTNPYVPKRLVPDVSAIIKTALTLIEAGANVNAKGSTDGTPLHLVAWWGQAKIAHALIEAGADVNAKNEIGLTPLHYAAKDDHIEVAFALVKGGADLYAPEDNGYIPLDFAVTYHGRNSAIAAFLQGAMKKQADKKRQKADELLRELE